MKVSLNWLKDYVDIDLVPEKLAEKLTMVGLEATDLKSTGEGWDNVFVGEVTNIEKHPDADRLCLATVNLGDEQLTVVCGAPNIETGQKICFAKTGAVLFNPYAQKIEKLKPSKIRGIKSEGMVCSEVELGISDNHEGILVLAPDAPTAMPLADYMGDVVFDITVTPNRPDCLNMLGIAREASAITGKIVRIPDVQYEELSETAESMITIEIGDPDLCPRYCGGIIRDVKIGASPAWMQERLTAAGMRPINNIVDITNFVMLEYGQPLHAFDYERIGGKKIIVRRARDGEIMTTLDGEKRDLTSDMLLICDANQPVALAGVMGGEDSEITEQTTTIMLESANFNNVSIRRTSRKLGLLSEASTRFDKGLSPELPMAGIRRAMQLMVELAEGKALQGIVDAFPGFKERKPILISEQKASQVLGIDFGIDRIRQTLQTLGFECKEQNSKSLLVTVPYWRTDVTIVEDLIEEVARIIGYDEIPTTMLSSRVPHHEPTPLASLRERIRDILVGCGMQETINYSLTSQAVIEKAGYEGEVGPPVRMANPMSIEQEFLRLSLRGGLLNMFAANERHHESGIMLFEIGKVYLPVSGQLPNEKLKVCGVIGGPLSAQTWFGDNRNLDFFDAKGILETLFVHLGIEAEFTDWQDKLLIPGRTASILVKGKNVGIIGELHPELLDTFDISTETVCLFEIDIHELLGVMDDVRSYQSISRFPSTDRDLALVVDTNIPAKQIQDIIYSFPQVNLSTLFDVYQGKQVPEGKKSLAFALQYQSRDRTLTDKEVDKIQQKLLMKLEKETGAVLRQ